MKQAQYRIIFFTKAQRFVGIAWNYNDAVLISTRDQPTYAAAKSELTAKCEELSVALRWFDGEYVCRDGETLEPANAPSWSSP